MDIKKLKYMKKLAMKYAKYLYKAEKFKDASFKASEKNNAKKEAKYERKAHKFRSKAYYIKEVYDLEVAIQGSIHNFDTTWETL